MATFNFADGLKLRLFKAGFDIGRLRKSVNALEATEIEFLSDTQWQALIAAGTITPKKLYCDIVNNELYLGLTATTYKRLAGIPDDTKVSKAAPAVPSVYATDSSENQSTIPFAESKTASTLAVRTANGEVLTGDPSHVDAAAPKWYVDAAIANSVNILYVGGYTFGQLDAGSTRPAPADSTQTLFDFTSNTPYTAKSDLSGWEAGTAITPTNGTAVGIETSFYDHPIDPGYSGDAKWNGTSWDVYLSRFAQPDGVTVGYDAAGSLEVKVSSVSGNSIEQKTDGLYVRQVQELPTIPTTAGTYMLVVDASGNVTWQTYDLMGVQG